MVFLSSDKMMRAVCDPLDVPVMVTRSPFNEEGSMNPPFFRMMFVCLLCILLPGMGEMYLNCAKADVAAMNRIKLKIYRTCFMVISFLMAAKIDELMHIESRANAKLKTLDSGLSLHLSIADKRGRGRGT